jgi:hypothetical protein
MMMLGPPCVSAGMKCPFADVCCFDTIGASDSCNASNSDCSGADLHLDCTEDADCSGQSCCVVYNLALGYLEGTECRGDCLALNTYDACNPLTSPSCNCANLLDGYYADNMAKPPYDAYGQCN